MKNSFLIFPILNSLFITAFAQSCLSTTKGLTIAGNDLNGVKGAATDCCQLCQQKFGCRAWTWDSFNGGTCWLKNDTQPLSKSGSPVALTGFVSPSADRVYSTKYEWNATNFWDAPWHFDQWALTSVTKNVDKATAQSLNMIGYNNSRVYMGVDHVYPYPISGRPSIQIASTYLFNSGLFVLSLEHMPTGPGVWPSWWMTGPDWPNKGEIDIMEGIFNMTYNMNSILTGNTTKGGINCLQKHNNTDYFNGTWVETHDVINCDHGKSFKNSTFEQSGACSIHAPNGTFNTFFNEAGGGVFAMQWDPQESIRIWIFTKADIPADLESPSPNPDTWGLPTGYFKLGDNCSPDHFANHTIMFDIALCGGWVAAYFPRVNKW